MTYLELEIKNLKESILEMMQLVHSQLEKSKVAFLEMDLDLAEEIIHSEKRVNAMELAIDRDCENIFARFNPLATDLRFVVSMLKMNSDLERIGDYADGIADYVVEFNHPVSKELLEKTELPRMFDIAISMVEDMAESFETEDTELGRKVFKKDTLLNEINKNAPEAITKFVTEHPKLIPESLYTFSTVKKIERIGDHVKNVSEDLIFYLEAEVLKHKKLKKNKKGNKGK